MKILFSRNDSKTRNSWILESNDWLTKCTASNTIAYKNFFQLKHINVCPLAKRSGILHNVPWNNDISISFKHVEFIATSPIIYRFEVKILRFAIHTEVN